jgi:uncharacterized delta-60 repeat protein
VHENGDLDTTFDPSASSTVNSFFQQSDGKILLGGNFTSVSGTTRNRIARVHENGDLDTTFDPSANSTVFSVFQQSDGKILLGGSFTSVSDTARNGIARVHENGDLDTTFDFALTGPPGEEEGFQDPSVSSVVQQSDGKILLSGAFASVSGTDRNGFARVHENGDLDTTFDPSASSTVNSFFQQSDGKILLGGQFTSVSGTTRNRIARVHENGDLDTTFDPSANFSVRSVVQQSDGKILLGGYFTSVSDTARNRIARVHENGDLDTTFDPNVNAGVLSVVQQSDGKVLLGGSFDSVSDTTRSRIARLEDAPLEKLLHIASDQVESVDLYVASVSSSPSERDFVVYVDDQAVGKFIVDDNSGAKKIFSIPPTFGAGVEITANRTSLDHTLMVFGHVNVQEDNQ